MLKALKQLLDRGLAGEREEALGHTLEMAAAALLIEVMRADHHDDPAEEAAVVAALRQSTTLTEPELQALVTRAADTVSESISLFEFTSVLNGALTPQDKVRLLESLWRVAFADGRIDRYEDYTIRKIADLLYMSHADFIRTKHRVGG